MDRRSFIRGALFAAASPAIVRISSLMPIKVYDDLVFGGPNPGIVHVDMSRLVAADPAWLNKFYTVVAEEYQVPFKMLRPVIVTPEEKRAAKEFYEVVSRVHQQLY